MTDIVEKLREGAYNDALDDKLMKQAAGEIARLRDALAYVLEDDYGLLPRASSSCREHIRQVLKKHSCSAVA